MPGERPGAALADVADLRDELEGIGQGESAVSQRWKGDGSRRLGLRAKTAATKPVLDEEKGQTGKKEDVLNCIRLSRICDLELQLSALSFPLTIFAPALALRRGDAPPGCGTQHSLGQGRG